VASPVANPVAPPIAAPADPPTTEAAPQREPIAEPFAEPVNAPVASPFGGIFLTCDGLRPVISAVCDSSRGVWIVSSNVLVPPETTLNVTGRVDITGNFTLTPTSTVRVTLSSTSTTPITVSGCAQFDGTLEVSLPSEAVISGTTFTLATYSGLCTAGTEFSAVKLAVPPQTRSCEAATSTAQYGPTSLVLLVSVDLSACSSPSESSIGSPNLQPVAIAFIVIAIVAVAAGVIGVLFWQSWNAKKSKQMLQEMSKKHSA
jgi:hypothetical protein